MGHIIQFRRRKWTGAQDYSTSRSGKNRRSWWIFAPVWGAAALFGTAYGAGWLSSGDAGAHVETSKIEWNAVQAAPQRALDAQDVAWQRRAVEQDRLSTSPGRAVAERATFSYCKWGGGTNCVVDGDTFWIDGQKVRIAGIDAPETHDYRCPSELALGNAATEKLHALLNSGTVTMTSIDRDRDRYGRLLRNVSVNGVDVGEAMISAGVAREYGSGRRPWC